MFCCMCLYWYELCLKYIFTLVTCDIFRWVYENENVFMLIKSHLLHDMIVIKLLKVYINTSFMWYSHRLHVLFLCVFISSIHIFCISLLQWKLFKYKVTSDIFMFVSTLIRVECVRSMWLFRYCLLSNYSSHLLRNL